MHKVTLIHYTALCTQHYCCTCMSSPLYACMRSVAFSVCYSCSCGYTAARCCVLSRPFAHCYSIYTRMSQCSLSLACLLPRLLAYVRSDAIVVALTLCICTVHVLIPCFHPFLFFFLCTRFLCTSLCHCYLVILCACVQSYPSRA